MSAEGMIDKILPPRQGHYLGKRVMEMATDCED